MTKVILLIIFSELWGTAGQIFYKIGLAEIDTPNLRDHRSYLKFMGRVLATPHVWMGIGLIIVGFVVWLTVLAQANLSFAFPVDSMHYIITMIAARVFLDEKIDKLKLAGTILVVGGVILVAIS